MPGDGSPLRFEVLGPLRAVRGDTELDLGPAKQRAVLAVLLLEAGRVVPTPRIVDAVWGDEPPENGANVVQKYVAGLRRVLDPDRSPRTPGALLPLTGGGYRLAVEPGALDAGAFRADVARATAERDAGRPADATAILRSALDRWHGPALAGLTGPVFDAARNRLTEEHVTAWETWADCELSLGNAGSVVGELVRLVGEFPTREALRAQLMTALHATGRQAEALAVYREAHRYLAEEFGVEPGERLRGTHRQILHGTAPVSPPPPRPAAVPAPVAPPVPMPPALPPVTPLPAPPPGVAPVPASRRRGAKGWPSAHRPYAEMVAAIVLPLVTCTLGSWIYFAYASVRRRDWRLLAVSAGFAVAVLLQIVTIGLVAEDNGETSTGGDIMIFTFLVGSLVSSMVVGGYVATHVADTPYRRRAREFARMYALTDPDAARWAGVGRPDLPRLYDDGGLVDVNHVPGHQLSALPGIDPGTAHRIVVDRAERGPYRVPEDLVARGLIGPEALHRIGSRLVCVPPQRGEISADRPR